MSKTPKSIDDAELHRLIVELKRQLPDGAIVGLFVFQNSPLGVLTDYISNSDTESFARAVGVWADMYLSGQIDLAAKKMEKES